MRAASDRVRSPEKPETDIFPLVTSIFSKALAANLVFQVTNFPWKKRTGCGL